VETEILVVDNASSDDSAAIALVQPMASDKDVQVARAVERALARLRQLK